MADQLERWQREIDKAFPRGVLASWQQPDSAVYVCPWIEVCDIRGVLPVVAMCASASEKVLGPWLVTGHEVIRTDPFQIWLVTYAGVVEKAMWSAGVSFTAGNQMKAERAEQIAARPWTAARS